MLGQGFGGSHCGWSVDEFLTGEDDDEAIGLQGGQHGHLHPFPVATQHVQFMLSGRGTAHDHTQIDTGTPPEGGSARDELLVGVGADHGIDDEGFQSLVPGAAALGGSGIHLGGCESDLSGVVDDGGTQDLAISAWHLGFDLSLDDLNRGADQLDGLVQRDLASHGSRCHVDDVGWGVGLGVVVSKPLHKAVDAGSGHDRNPRPLLGRKVAEPGMTTAHLLEGGGCHGGSASSQALRDGSAGAVRGDDGATGTRRSARGRRRDVIPGHLSLPPAKRRTV